MERRYLFNTKIGVNEDECHEFKSHRTLSADEMPAWTTTTNEGTGQVIKSRQPVSKTIVAFLNTGRGGVCYLGVQNDGMVKGLKLTTYQKDHLIVSLYDILDRYNPKVERHQVQVNFIPVLSRENEDYPKEVSEYAKVDENDARRWKKPHSMRTPAYCWCDKDVLTRYNMGLLPLSYVVEITVKPWDGKAHQRMLNTPLPPIYQNERGLAYIRRLASNIQIGVQEVVVMTKNQIHNYYKGETEKLEKELEQLQQEAIKNLNLTDIAELDGPIAEDGVVGNGSADSK